MSITLKQIAVAAPDEPQVTLLKDISFTLEKGDLTLLIGHAGSGKSTLLQVMSGLLRPQSGSVTLDDKSMWVSPKKVDPDQLLRIGLTFQFPEQQLFARSIREEFAYSLRPYKLPVKERERCIREATDNLDPHGIFAMDRSPFALSGGEQRRLALATTFATAPDWLLMDEPTAGLEAAAVRELLRMLRERKDRGDGTVVATHDLDTFFPLAGRVLVLDHGELVFDGSPQELCRAPEVLARAGVGLPSCAEAAVELARVGIAIAPDQLTPALAASAILAALREGGSAMHLAPAETAPEPAACAASAAQPAQPLAGWLRLDPRAKWLLYLLLTIGTMGQQGWAGLAVAAGLLGCAFLGLPRSVVHGVRKIAASYAIFLLFSVALAGVAFTTVDGHIQLGYLAESGWSTAFILVRLFVVLLAGYWLAMSTPYGQLVQGLNWALKYLHKVKMPVASFSLAVSFLFRFIPLIMREWQQFSTIVRARGKASVRPGSVRVRDIPALVVPLLLAMFHKAEQMTVAMEMKQVDGLTLLLRKNTLRWQRMDTYLAAAALLAYGLLFIFN